MSGPGRKPIEFQNMISKSSFFFKAEVSYADLWRAFLNLFPLVLKGAMVWDRSV